MEDLKKKTREKARFPRLSLKILLTLFVVAMALYAVLSIVFSIARATGFRLPEDRESLDLWMRLMIFVFPPAFGAGIIALFILALNKTVVARICRLEAATDEVSKGNFDIQIEVRGRDEISDLTHSFNRMSAELKHNEYLSKEFIRNVSHEFKTPLSAIRAYGELIDAAADEGTIDKAALKEYADVIVKESDRLAQLSKSILELSLLDGTTLVKRDDTFCVAEQIREILRLLHQKWAEKNLTLDLALEEITVTNNERLLYQVWQNLIGNAIKFSNPGGKISVGLKRDGDAAEFSVSDTGIGIKDEDKPKIFDHFYMADASRNTGGSGLGLAITKKILAKLGGEISFDSAEGNGSTFRVRI
ncbi:MAG: HAMP domain-containing histidine kinase [Firmicutes bacterium]|nr:HAMP domain-containing histidine kinase [Bacillota bacterium]